MRDSSKWTVPPDVLVEPAVQAVGRCDSCGWSASVEEREERSRDAAEALVVAELETMDTPVHGPTLDVHMPACPSCDHREAIEPSETP